MTFTFNNAIPQANDFIDESQGDLLNNNIALNGIFSRNHVPFINTTNGQGRHTFVEMVNTIGNVIPVPPAGLQNNSGTVYTKKAFTVSDLYYTNDNTLNEYKLTNVVTIADNNRFPYFGTNTNLTLAPVSAPGNAGFGGWTFLPGGLIMQYGKVTNPTNGQTITFPLAFTVSPPFSIQLTSVVDDNSTIRMAVLTGSETINKFEINSTGSLHLTALYWIAIGVY